MAPFFSQQHIDYMMNDWDQRGGFVTSLGRWLQEHVYSAEAHFSGNGILNFLSLSIGGSVDAIVAGKNVAVRERFVTEGLSDLCAIICQAYSVEDFKKHPERRIDINEMQHMVENAGDRGTFAVLELVIGTRPVLTLATWWMELREPENRQLYLGTLAVPPALQGMGIGNLVLEFVENYCSCVLPSVDHCLIWVVNVRKQLREWYSRHGFELMHEIDWPEESRHTLCKDVHFVVMKKVICSRCVVRQTFRFQSFTKSTPINSYIN